MSKFIITQTYEQIKKIKTIIEYNKTLKEFFLSEEMYNSIMKTLEEELKELRNKLKKLQE